MAKQLSSLLTKALAESISQGITRDYINGDVEGAGDGRGQARAEGQGEGSGLCVGALVKDARRETEGTRFTIVASADVRDRQGESIDQRGWSIPKVMPKVLYGHDYGGLPIGKIERARRSATDGLVLDVRLADAIEEHTMAVVAGALVRAGFLDQGSVGFRPLKWLDPDGTERSVENGDNAWFTMPGRRYMKQELYEFSLVTVPANPESVVLALRAMQGRGGKSMLSMVIEAGAALRKRRREEARKSPPSQAALEVVCGFCISGEAADARALAAHLAGLPEASERAMLLHQHLGPHYEALGMGTPPAVASVKDAFDLDWIRCTGQPFAAPGSPGAAANDEDAFLRALGLA